MEKKSRNYGGNQTLPPLAQKPRETKKLKLKVDKETETVTACTDEFESHSVGKVRTSQYSPSKSFAGGKPLATSFISESPGRSFISFHKKEKSNVLEGVEEIKVPRSEGKLRRPKTVEGSIASAKKYISDKTHTLKCNCGKYEKLPCCVRTKKWLDLVYSRHGLNFDYEKYYRQYKELLEVEDEGNVNAPVIKKDLNRTFPTSKFFEDSGEGQAQLERILKAYSCYDSKVGYVQGMNFIVGALLYHASEEITFWLFIALVEDYELRDLYLPGVPGLYKHCQIIDLLIFIHNRKVFAHFGKHEVKTEILIMDWLFSLFSSVIVIEKMGLFLDRFFESGWIFFYKFVIQIINQYEDEILSEENSEDVFGPIKKHKNTDSSITYASNSFLSRIPLINRLWGKEFWESLINDAVKIRINERQIKDLLASYDPTILTFRTTRGIKK